MKTRSVLSIAWAAVLFPAIAVAQEGMDPAGPQHAALMKRAGTYETTSRFSMPGMPGDETKGTATIKAACAGKFLLEENAGTMMGSPFTGIRLLGYNNGTKEYEATWVYSESTAFLSLRGKSDDDGKTLRLKGDVVEAGETMTLHVHYSFESDDKIVVKLYGGDPASKDTPVLEEVYTRKK